MNRSMVMTQREWADSNRINQIIEGDCLEVMRTWPDGCVHCVVTSPPYWGLRDYGIEPSVWGGDATCEHEWGECVQPAANGITHDGGMSGETLSGNSATRKPKRSEFCKICGAWRGCYGLEPTPELFVEHTVTIFREVRRVLRDDGTLWLNLGDSYTSGGRNTHGTRIGYKQESNTGCLGVSKLRPELPAGLKPKDIVGIPWRVAFALQADGWWLRQDIIWHKCLSGGTVLWARTQKGAMPSTIKDLARLRPETVELWNGQAWTRVVGWNKTPRPDSPIEIELRSGQRIGCTQEHRWPTNRGLVEAKDLKVGDIIKTTTLPDTDNMGSAGLPLSVARVVGWYLAEGSRSGDTIQFSLNTDERWMSADLRRFAEYYGGSHHDHVYGNSLHVCLESKVVNAILDTYISGNGSHYKHLTNAAWQRNNAFLDDILTGYLEGDGHHRQETDEWRLGFCNNDSLACDLRTICARLGYSIRMKRTQHRSSDGKMFAGYRGRIRKANHNGDDGEIVAIRPSRARFFYDVQVEDEPHLFSLASGVLTHNSNPMPESVTDRCTKAHEYLFLLTKSPRYFYDAEAVKEEGTGRRCNEFRRGVYVNNETFDNSCKLSGSQGEHISDAGRNKRSVWTIATAPFKEAHFACVDDETEALTPTGWRRQSELIDGCSIAAYNPDLGVLNWQPATFHRYDFDGELVSIEKRDSSQRLTPNHRCLVKRRNGQIAVVEAKNLMASMQVLTTATLVLEEGIGVGVGFAALLGWYVTEGECKRGNIVRINQSQSANPTHVSEIRRILDSLSAEYKECVRERIWRGRPSVEVAFNVRGAIASKIDDLCSDMMPKWAWVNWPLADVWAFLNAVIDGDGHRRKDGRRCIIQKNREFIDVVQAMTLRLGYRSQIGKHGDGWAVYLTSGQWLTLRGTNGAYHEIQRDRYSGTVWCPSVASTFWLARRNGKTFITGNTFPPELIRPCIRAGTSQKGCCPKCGAPWRRVLSKSRMATRPGVSTKIKVPGGWDVAKGAHGTIHRGGRTEATYRDVAEVGNRDLGRHVTESTTVGWQPDCGCIDPVKTGESTGPDVAYEPVPCMVLDPFGGSGTTGMVAAQEGRNYVMIERNPKYVQMARKTRLAPVETAVPLAEAKAGQRGLFESAPSVPSVALCEKQDK